MLMPIIAQAVTQPVDQWQLLIVALVPILIKLLRAKWPDVTAKWWPTLAPLLGAAADLCLFYAGATPAANPLLGSILGLTGVGLRELVYKWDSDRRLKQLEQSKQQETTQADKS